MGVKVCKPVLHLSEYSEYLGTPASTVLHGKLLVNLEIEQHGSWPSVFLEVHKLAPNLALAGYNPHLIQSSLADTHLQSWGRFFFLNPA